MLAKNEEKTGTQQERQISAAKLKKLVKAREGARKQTSEINGGIGDMVADAIEKDNLDKVAFAMACRLDRMSPEKLWVTLPALLYYIDELGLKEKAESAPPLPVEEETGEE